MTLKVVLTLRHSWSNKECVLNKAVRQARDRLRLLYVPIYTAVYLFLWITQRLRAVMKPLYAVA